MQTLLGPVLLDIHPNIKSLALDLASQAHAARAGSTVAQYKEPWKDFLAWAVLNKCKVRYPGIESHSLYT